VTNDAKVLESYSSDFSFVSPTKPSYVAFPETTSEVQKIVQIGNDNRIPVIPKSSEVSFQGGAIPTEGGIVIDLRRMNRILEIDERNRMARIEPGVKYSQLQGALKEHNLMTLNPLLPHYSKSVLTSHLERDPMLIPKFEYGDPTLAMEVILPTGKIFRTGSAAAPGSPDETIADLVGPYGPGLDFHKIFHCAQGTFGIVTWMSIKVELIPKIQKLYFIPFDTLDNAIGPIYRIQRLMLGNECFMLNCTFLASILSQGKSDRFESLEKDLPPWTLLLCIAGGNRRPEEKIEYEEEVLKAIGLEFHLRLSNTIPGGQGEERWIEEIFRQPWPETLPYWRFMGKSGCRTISFHTTFDRISQIHSAVFDRFHILSQKTGCYVQPVERARACYMEYGISYNLSDPKEMEETKNLEVLLNEFLYQQGVLFTRPYGVQAQIVYGRNTEYTTTLRELKGIFDPNHIMNPGKICF
jgi:FAD/FMN-containing dehydrogenase